MKHRIIPAAIFLLSIFIGYHATLRVIPTIMMKGAYERLSSANTPINAFSASRMITAENQTIVRSSPDLAYSVCLLDLTQNTVEVRGGVWNGYSSLTIFDENTDAVFVTSLDNNDTAKRGVIVINFDALPALPKRATYGENILNIKGDKAIALIRRYAPNKAAFDAAKIAGKEDVCAPYQSDLP